MTSTQSTRRSVLLLVVRVTVLVDVLRRLPHDGHRLLLLNETEGQVPTSEVSFRPFAIFRFVNFEGLLIVFFLILQVLVLLGFLRLFFGCLRKDPSHGTQLGQRVIFFTNRRVAVNITVRYSKLNYRNALIVCTSV